MRMQMRKRYHITRTIVFLVMAVSPIYVEAQLAAEDVIKIRRELEHIDGEPGPYFSEDSAEKFVHSYGPDAVPVLVAMLEDENISVRSKGRVAFYLGKFGDSKTVPVIWNLIARTSNGSIEKDEQFLLYFAMYGLGYAGSSGALEHLRELAGANYWTPRTVTPYGPNGSQFSTRTQFIKSLCEAALGALGDAGTTEAKAVLLQLKNAGAQDLHDTIDLWIEECERRIKGEPYTGDELGSF